MLEISDSKKCCACGAIKGLACFHKDQKSKDGVSYCCKECAIEKTHKWYSRNRERAIERRKEYYAKNREEAIKKAHEWCINNPDKRFKIHRKWYDANKEEKKVKDKIRLVEKREHIREVARRYYRIKRQDVRIRLSYNMSRAMHHVLKKGKKNNRHWESLAGYSRDELMKHLEKQFLPGMSWDNYGVRGWHIDHIIPKSAFNFTDIEDIDFKKCWELKNLRPLWATDNIVKGAKVTKPFQPSLAIAI